MKFRYLTDVITLKYDISKCTGCGMCAVVCPHRVFAMKDNNAEIVDFESCMECGACQKNCAFDAITVDSGVGCAYAVINSILKKE